MKRVLIFFVFSVIWVFFPVESRADEAGYTIQDYYLEATLRENNVYEVKEIIACNFSEPRHGLYRAVPENFYVGKQIAGNGKNKRYVPMFEDVSVEGEPYETLSENGNFVIRIGDADEEIEGEHTYEFSYRYVVPDDRIGSTDFLYYSVLGAEWATTIDRFHFKIVFDKPIPQESVEGLKIFSGSYGTERNDLNCEVDATTTEIQGEVDNIEPENAITLYTLLPEGYFVDAYKIPELPCKIFFVLLMAASAIFVARILIAVAKRKTPVQTVEFYPPEGMTSAHVGMVIDEKADLVDIISLIPWMAARGYLSLKEVVDEKRKKKKRAGDTSLHAQKERELDGSEPQCVKDVYKALFARKESVNLSRLSSSAGEKIDAAVSGLKKEFTGEKKLSTGKIWTYVIVSVELVLYIVAVGLSSKIEWFESTFCAACAAVLLFFATNTIFRGIVRESSAKWKIVLLRLKTVVFTLAALGMQYYFCIDENIIPVSVLWLCFGVTAGVCLLSGFVVVSTPYRVELLGKLLGLREFIRVAEESRLRMLLDENPEYFYDILPYAMVFGMADKWADKFVNIEMEQPDWYRSDVNTFSLYAFHTMLITQTYTDIQSSISDARAQAAASSSSSGGYSGGGGGGGGGGSW